MKRNFFIGSLILLTAIFFAVACKKSVEQPDQNQNPGSISPNDTTLSSPVIPYPTNPTPECSNAPDYGDSIVYPQPRTSGDYYVMPVNNQGIDGTYLAWPDGLSL